MFSRKLGDSEYELCYSHVIPRSVLNRLEGVLLLFLRLTLKENGQYEKQIRKKGVVREYGGILSYQNYLASYYDRQQALNQGC